MGNKKKIILIVTAVIILIIIGLVYVIFKAKNIKPVSHEPTEEEIRAQRLKELDELRNKGAGPLSEEEKNEIVEELDGMQGEPISEKDVSKQIEDLNSLRK